MGSCCWLPWKPRLPQGLNGFLFADVQFFRAGPGIGRGLGTASCVSRFRHPAQWHPPQQVSWEQAGCPGLKASSWPLVLLLLPSPAGKWREAEGVSQLFEERVLVFSCILFFLSSPSKHEPLAICLSPCWPAVLAILHFWISVYLPGTAEFVCFHPPWYTGWAAVSSLLSEIVPPAADEKGWTTAIQMIQGDDQWL